MSQRPSVQPDYGQFFPFAFFFTILHVVALMVATVPAGTCGIAAHRRASMSLGAVDRACSVLYRK